MKQQTITLLLAISCILVQTPASATLNIRTEKPGDPGAITTQQAQIINGYGTSGAGQVVNIQNQKMIPVAPNQLPLNSWLAGMVWNNQTTGTANLIQPIYAWPFAYTMNQQIPQVVSDGFMAPRNVFWLGQPTTYLSQTKNTPPQMVATAGATNKSGQYENDFYIYALGYQLSVPKVHQLGQCPSSAQAYCIPGQAADLLMSMVPVATSGRGTEGIDGSLAATIAQGSPYTYFTVTFPSTAGAKQIIIQGNPQTANNAKNGFQFSGFTGQQPPAPSTNLIPFSSGSVNTYLFMVNQHLYALYLPQYGNDSTITATVTQGSTGSSNTPTNSLIITFGGKNTIEPNADVRFFVIADLSFNSVTVAANSNWSASTPNIQSSSGIGAELASKLVGQAFNYITGAYVTMDSSNPDMMLSVIGTTLNYTLKSVADVTSGSSGTVLAVYPHQYKNIVSSKSGNHFITTQSQFLTDAKSQQIAAYTTLRGSMQVALLPQSTYTYYTPVPAIATLMQPLSPKDTQGIAQLQASAEAWYKHASAIGTKYHFGIDSIISGQANIAEAGQILNEDAIMVVILQQLAGSNSQYKSYVQTLYTAVLAGLRSYFGGDGNASNYFAYNTVTGSVNGYPQYNNNSSAQNDHAAIYGNFVNAIATLLLNVGSVNISGNGTVSSELQPYLPYIEFLQNDYAGLCSVDPNYVGCQPNMPQPALQGWDSFSGNYWPTGLVSSAYGPSEGHITADINAAMAMIRLGTALKNDQMIALGTYLYVMQASNAQIYWSDYFGMYQKLSGITSNSQCNTFVNSNCPAYVGDFAGTVAAGGLSMSVSLLGGDETTNTDPYAELAGSMPTAFAASSGLLVQFESQQLENNFNAITKVRASGSQWTVKNNNYLPGIAAWTTAIYPAAGLTQLAAWNALRTTYTVGPDKQQVILPQTPTGIPYPALYQVARFYGNYGYPSPWIYPTAYDGPNSYAGIYINETGIRFIMEAFAQYLSSQTPNYIDVVQSEGNYQEYFRKEAAPSAMNCSSTGSCTPYATAAAIPLSFLSQPTSLTFTPKGDTGGLQGVFMWDKPATATQYVYSVNGKAPVLIKEPQSCGINYCTGIINLGPINSAHPLVSFALSAISTADNVVPSPPVVMTMNGAKAVVSWIAPNVTATQSTTNLTTAIVNWSATATNQEGLSITYTVSTSPTLQVSNATSTSATLTGLQPSISYAVTVIASDGVNNSQSPSTQLQTVPTTISWAAGAVSVSNISGSQATVTWPAATDNYGGGTITYTVTATSSNGGSPVTASGLTGTSTILQGLSQGNYVYTVTVTAVDGSINNANTSTPTFNTAVQTTLPTPQNIQVTSTNTSTAASSTVTWNAITDPNTGSPTVSYTVSISPAPASASVPSQTVTQPTATFNNLTPSTAYTVNIIANDSLGAKSATATQAFNTSDTGALSAPGAISFGAVSYSSGGSVTTATIPMSWGASTDTYPNPGTITYTVTTTPALAGGPITTTNNQNVQLTGLALGTTYNVSVTASDQASHTSTAATATTPNTGTPTISAPGTPTQGTVTYTGTSPNLTASVPITWAAPADNWPNAGGTFTYTVTTTGGPNSPAPFTTTINSATLSGLAVSSNYSITVQAVDGGGNKSPNSLAGIVATGNPLPAAPTSGCVFVNSTSMASALLWAPVNGVNNYVISGKNINNQTVPCNLNNGYCSYALSYYPPVLPYTVASQNTNGTSTPTTITQEVAGTTPICNQ